MIQSNTTTTYRLGQIVGLECLFTVFPMPSVMWIKNNAMVPLGEHYTVKAVVNGPAYYQLKSVLIINSLTTADIGSYRCKVHDEANNIMMQSKNVSIGNSTIVDL